MIFSNFLEQVESIKSNQANYQPVTICHLLHSENFRASKLSIQEKLAKANNTDNVKSFSGCPVFKVLIGKNMIEKIGESDYRLSVKMTDAQKKQIEKLCMEMLRK